jgi:hypothetical protein
VTTAFGPRLYRQTVADKLDRAAPLPITKELGDAIAGRPFVIPIVDARKNRKAELK